MEALELLQRLISDPTERIRYKQNPEAYLSSRGLDEKARKLFSDTLNQCSPRQVATVMTLTASLNSDLTQEIDLEGEAVTLYSDEHFFIDKGTTGSGLLLEGSYADINAKKFIFKLIYRGCINKLLDRQRVSKAQISERTFRSLMKTAAYANDFIHT